MVSAHIEELLAKAVEGDRTAAEKFFHQLRETTFSIPERFQEQPLSDAPPYPDDFFNFLGIQARDGKVYIPVFTRSELIEEWCGNKLAFRTVPGAELLTRIPESWWLTVNPGSEFGKEISPWEINHLRSGDKGIPLIISELFPEIRDLSVKVAPADTEELRELVTEVTKVAQELPIVRTLYALRQLEQGSENGETELVLLGIEFDGNAPKDAIETATTTIDATAKRSLIGSYPVRVFAATEKNREITLGIFLKEKPIFER